MSKTILITDDSMMSRLTVKKNLPVDWATTIHEAKNGIEAMEKLENHVIDVLFLDLTMPEMDGFAVLERLADPASTIPRPAIFVLSADIQPESMQICKARGALAFISKPIKAEALAEVLRGQGLLS